jgi:hypothetical protein
VQTVQKAHGNLNKVGELQRASHDPNVLHHPFIRRETKKSFFFIKLSYLDIKGKKEAEV